MLIQYMLYIYLLFILGLILENSTGDRGNLQMVYLFYILKTKKKKLLFER